jgi:hypothetical protein
MKPLVPYQLATILNTDISKRRRVVQIISRPTPENTIMVRMVPGEPTTMIQLPIEGIEHVNEKKPLSFPEPYLHVAEVDCNRMVFAEDMLRYDNAFLFDHTLNEESEDRPDKPVHVYRLFRARTISPWTIKRWNSFGMSIKPLYIKNLRDNDPQAERVDLYN